jgi:hypothetical protein
MHAGDLESADALLAEARVGYQELGDDAYQARATRRLATCRLLRAGNKVRRSSCAPARPRRPETAGWDLAESPEELSLIQAATGDPRRPATLAAAAGAIRERTRTQPHPFDRSLAEPYLRLARTDRNACDPGRQAGVGMPLDDIIKLVAGDGA